MSPDYFVNELCKMTETKDIKCVLVWNEDPRGGYSAVVNEVKLHLSVPVASPMRLVLQRGMFEAYIDRPVVHIAEAPIGKALRRVSSSIAQSLDSSSDYSWPRPPTSPKEIEAERLRLALDRLWNLVAGQQAAHEALRYDATARNALFETALGFGQKKS